MTNPDFIPFDPFVPVVSPEEAAKAFHAVLSQRRSVREFSSKEVSPETIDALIACAHSAPSGANKQPWRFVCVQNPDLKHAIRLGAEEEERAFYHERAPQSWKDALAPLGTDEHKEYLEIAPWLVVVFRLAKDEDGSQIYYGDESCGIATGMFLAAAQMAGLATLTHTPSPMKFLGELLNRPSNERPYLLIPVGYPAEGCEVPAHGVARKPLEEIRTRL